MKFTKRQGRKFETLVRPLMQFLEESCHPHIAVLVRCESAVVLEGQYACTTFADVEDALEAQSSSDGANVVPLRTPDKGGPES